MTTETNSNLPVLSVDQTVTMLSEAYLKLLTAGRSPAVFPSVMLWGPPGVGKSQAVRQIGRAIEAGSGRRVAVTDVRLLLFNPIDLRGIPVANEDKTLAIWLKPKIFQMDESPETVNILFLDEISAAPQSVQAAAYQITLDRVVGEHRLPDNCIVIAAGNRVTDRSVAYKMPKALANRLLHIEVAGSFESWREWAVSTGIHEKVLGFLAFRGKLFDFDAAGDDLAFPTPRSWEMVSNLLTYVNEDAEEIAPLISGLIGTGTTLEFKTWCKTFRDLPDMDAIFDGKNATVPKRRDILYALVSSMVHYASEHRYETDRISNSLHYARRLPPEFIELLLLGYRSLDPGYSQTLMSLPEYTALCAGKGALRNGNV